MVVTMVDGQVDVLIASFSSLPTVFYQGFYKGKGMNEEVINLLVSFIYSSLDTKCSTRGQGNRENSEFHWDSIHFPSVVIEIEVYSVDLEFVCFILSSNFPTTHCHNRELVSGRLWFGTRARGRDTMMECSYGRIQSSCQVSSVLCRNPVTWFSTK